VRLRYDFAGLLFATPLTEHAVEREYLFSDGLSVNRLENVDWDRSVAKGYLSLGELERLRSAGFWLCGQWDMPPDAGFKHLRKAIITAQILCPSGADGVFLAFHETPGGRLENVAIDRESPLAPSLEGHLRELHHSAIDLLGTAFLRLNQAYAQRIMRLVNPVELLFHGLRANNEYISPILWIAGLDMLLMAGGAAKFETRAVSFLGGSTFVFPPDYAGRQLSYTVEDLAKEVYEFRNVTAHGQHVTGKYLDVENLKYLIGAVDCPLRTRYRYQLLGDAAASLLCSVLRKVFIEDLLAPAKTDSAWRTRLKGTQVP
jgi:hypothetical protein